MFEYISGYLVEATPTYFVVDVNGVGYLLHVSLSTYETLRTASKVKLYVHQVIREDVHLLYGFAEKAEREMFLLLISVSGVGASIARMMLSSMTIYEIQSAISTANSNALKKVKGVGAKTAERICVDLKDKVVVTAGGAGLAADISISSETQVEAISALLMLGFVKSAVEKVVKSILKSDPSLAVEEVIKQALKLL
ncbi:MAG: Holliday junction branch migration protein RuvA [Bacteroidales bacterium]